MIDLDIALRDLIGNATPGRGRRRPVLRDPCPCVFIDIFGFDTFEDMAPDTLEDPGPGDALR